MDIKYAVYADGTLIHVCSKYADSIPATDWAIENGYRTRVEEVSENGTRVIMDALNGNKESE